MDSLTAILKDLGMHMHDAGEMERIRASIRYQANYRRLVSRLNAEKEDPLVFRQYSRNVKAIREQVETMAVTHRTGLDEVISILEGGALLSIQRQNDMDIPFIWHLSSSGGQGLFENYVFCHPGASSLCFGQFELRLDVKVDDLTFYFLPKGLLHYPAHEITEHLIEGRFWREYLTELIAVRYGTVEAYFRKVPVQQRPELLFAESIPAERIVGIACATSAAYQALHSALAERFGADSSYLTLLTTG